MDTCHVRLFGYKCLCQWLQGKYNYSGHGNKGKWLVRSQKTSLRIKDWQIWVEWSCLSISYVLKKTQIYVVINYYNHLKWSRKIPLYCMPLKALKGDFVALVRFTCMNFSSILRLPPSTNFAPGLFSNHPECESIKTKVYCPQKIETTACNYATTEPPLSPSGELLGANFETGNSYFAIFRSNPLFIFQPKRHQNWGDPRLQFERL